MAASKGSIVLAWTAQALACASQGGDLPGYPLYPNPQNRLSADVVARLAGTCSGPECSPPIQFVDGKDVSPYGSAFDLLPGCHIVQLGSNFVASTMYVSFHGGGGGVFALRMEAGHRYVIRRDIVENPGSGARVVITAREEDAHGASTPIEPAHDPAEITACREWHPSVEP